MEEPSAIISARSMLQALDWSLVLMSQGIASTIKPGPKPDTWQLLVDGNDSQRAIQALRQYRVENRSPVWRQRLPWTRLIFDGRSLGWFLLLAVIFWLGETRFSTLRGAGVMDSQAVWSGQWWRLFTAITLHRDLPHLVSNITVGIVLLGLALGSFGSGIGLLACYLAGVAGNVAGLFLYAGGHRSLGASGMIFGALGLLSGQVFGLVHTGLTARQLTLRALLSGFLFLVLFGLNPDTDVIAHIAGFFTGVFFGSLLARWAKRLTESSLANRLAELLCASVVILTWWLALG